MSAVPSQPPGASAAAGRSEIDKASALPFYEQLKEILRTDVRRRGLHPGDRLWGDHELCERYGISRTVVRQALADLEREGLVDRVKGRGTFVAQGLTTQRLVQSLSGLAEDVAAQGRRLTSQVRRLEVVPAGDDVAERLGLVVGAPVVVLERLRHVDGEPWVLATSHLPAHLVPGLVQHDLREVSLYGLLESAYGIRLVSGRRMVEARTASSHLARDLRVAPGAPILTLTSTSCSADGRAVETFVAHHRADRSRFEVDLERVDPDRSLPGVVQLVPVPSPPAALHTSDV